MAFSSDEIIKREIIDKLGYRIGNINLRIFPQSSNEDQKLFSNGGLTFGYKGVSYGSCDASWFVNEKWVDGFNNQTINVKPIIALEGTDALNRGSSGNAQYQRFHHALGAVKNGILGIYYLKKGKDKIQPDLFGVAYYASKAEIGKYLIVDELDLIEKLLKSYNDQVLFNKIINEHLEKMHDIFLEKFNKDYGGSWDKFALKRSTIIKNDYVIKFAARNKRNFTDGSQRAGHIAVGEMFLTKYYFYDKLFYYLFPRMTREEMAYLDKHKSNDKEWHLLRSEPNVQIKTIDDIKGLDPLIRSSLMTIKDSPLSGGVPNKIYKLNMTKIVEGLTNGTLIIE